MGDFDAMKHVPQPSWGFGELVQNCWRAYVGGGVESTGRRLTMMRTWGALVGGERAAFELDRFVHAEGGWEHAAETAGAAASSLKRLRKQFLQAKGTAIAPRAPSLAAGENLRGAAQSYRVVGQVGAGGMGQVYEVATGASERFAAKLLSSERFEITSTVRSRFRREAEIASRFTHRNVVRAVELLQRGPDLVIIMELVAGPRLLDELRKARPSAERSLDWMIQLADGLAYMHEQEIVHRDIAPKNVLFRSFPNVVALADFGVARHVDDATLTVGAEQFGSLLYISPQQKADPHAVTEADDVYSLGQVFAYCATGDEPHAVGGTIAVEEQSIPAPVVRLIERMRAAKRGDRPRDGREVAAELRTAIGDASPSAGQISPVGGDPSTTAVSE